MRITVTQEDIDSAVRYSEDSCPVAFAIARHLNVAVQVSGRIVLVGVGAKRDYDLSKGVSHFIAHFDNGEDVKPFSFNLPDIPKSFIRKGVMPTKPAQLNNN